VFAASIIRAIIALMMEAASISEMSVNQTIWRNIPEVVLWLLNDAV
jgi:hypothetical protein